MSSSPPLNTRQRLLATLDGLKTWSSGGKRAPHKPLLLLWTLGRIRSGAPRLASYGEDVKEPLKRLLQDFGPPRRVPHPENPFWHLQSKKDAGLWELAGATGLSVRPGGSPSSGMLARHGVRGGLSEVLHKLLQRDPKLLREAANKLLFGHFPESMHDAIRDAVGLPRDDMVVETTTSTRAKRDPAFRDAVLRAYERRCTVCGFDLQVDGKSFGLEAAHIRWHSEGGPDRVPNGLALCTFHHRAFDRGIIGIERDAGDHRLLVSDELTGQSAAYGAVLDLRGQPLRPPQAEAYQPADKYVAWHRDQVFRGNPRGQARA